MSSHYELANAHKNTQKLLAYYVNGFLLCILLTVGAFFLVQHQVLTNKALFMALSGLALLQLLVQVVCFIRLNTASEEARWDFIAFLFTVFVAIVVIGGSLWIMYNLNYYMVH